MSTNFTRRPAPLRYDTAKLANEETRSRYQACLEQRLAEGFESENRSQTETWQKLVDDMSAVAADVIGLAPKRARNDWFDEECRVAITIKNAARAKLLQRRTRANLEAYRSRRSEERRLFRRKQKQKEAEALVEIEELSQSRNTRDLFRKVRMMRDGRPQQPLLCKSSSGEVLVEEERFIERWAEYFRGLLNATQAPQADPPMRAASTSIVDVLEPSYEEVLRAITNIKNHKAPGTDNIPGELLKYGGTALWRRVYELVLSVWREEQLPDEWKVGIIVPLYKKGDKLDCSNYRGITLLNIAYKVFANVLYRRLLPFAEENVGEYQSGFRANRSTTDQVFAIRHILEKCREFNVDTHHLFVDFKAAYDSVEREQLWGAMAEFGFPPKLISLTKMTMAHVSSKVRINGRLSEPFDTCRGLRQGDPLATLLFNIVLEKAVRASGVDPNGTIFGRLRQLLAYADDVDILGRNRSHVEEAFVALQAEAARLGLQVNVEKTKYMVASTSASRTTNQVVNIGGSSFEVVDAFTYLGSEVNKNNDISTEVTRRITAANRCFYSLNQIFRSRFTSRKLKCKLYQSLVRPVLTYGSEAWCLTQREEQRLGVFERGILRKIFGGIFENGAWRRRTNAELQHLFGAPDVMRFIKVGRLRWLGHIERMGNDRVPKKLLQGRPEGTRRAGRPRPRWMDAARKDLEAMRVRNWREVAQDRPRWRSMLEEAKTCNRL